MTFLNIVDQTRGVVFENNVVVVDKVYDQNNNVLSEDNMIDFIEKNKLLKRIIEPSCNLTYVKNNHKIKFIFKPISNITANDYILTLNDSDYDKLLKPLNIDKRTITNRNLSSTIYSNYNIEDSFYFIGRLNCKDCNTVNGIVVSGSDQLLALRLAKYQLKMFNYPDISNFSWNSIETLFNNSLRKTDSFCCKNHQTPYPKIYPYCFNSFQQKYINFFQKFSVADFQEISLLSMNLDNNIIYQGSKNIILTVKKGA